MLPSTPDLISLTVGLGLLCLGVLRVLMVLSPSLRRRLSLRRQPEAPESPGQQRTASLIALCNAGASFSFGGVLLFRPLASFVCTSPTLVQGVPLVFYAIAAALLIAQAHLSGKLASTSTKPLTPQQLRLWSLVGAVVGAALSLGLLYVGLNYILNRPFETLDHIQMVSPTEGWAIGNEYFSGLMYHYVGGRWVKVPIPDIHLLTGLSMSSPDEGWAVGDGSTMLHYQNGVWRSTPSPAGELRAVAMVSADEGWAVGNFGVILHYIPQSVLLHLQGDTSGPRYGR